MFQLDTRSNRFIATIGTGVALLLALNLGIIVHSHFLMPPYSASEVITYFLAFMGAISFTVYKTIEVLTNPHPRYVEGLVLGIFGSTAVLLYLPSLLFEPLVDAFPSVFPFFAASYLFSVFLTALLIAGVVKGSELYCESETGERENDNPTTEEQDSEDDDKTEQETIAESDTETEEFPQQ